LHRPRRAASGAPVCGPSTQPGAAAIRPVRRDPAGACRRRHAHHPDLDGREAGGADQSGRHALLLLARHAAEENVAMTILQAHDLTVERGGRRIIDAVSLRLESGAFVAVIGPNGAGKSTLMSALAGLLMP